MTLLNTDLSTICAITDTDFQELFDHFFIVRTCNIEDYIDLTNPEYYRNCCIYKFEIKDGLSYHDFLNKLLDKIVEYYMDGESDIKLKNFVLRQLNQYIPIKGLSIDKLKSISRIDTSDSSFMTGEVFFTLLESKRSNKLEFNKLLVCVPFEELKVHDVESEEEYLLDNGLIRSTRQILGHLHGDLGEFMLFFMTEGFLRHPVLFSKISKCKSSPGDKVKGSDGIHISIENGELTYNFLESKITKSFSNSLTQAFASNEEFLLNQGQGDINNEVTLLFNHKDTVDKKFSFIFDNGFKEEIIPYLDNTDVQEHLPFSITTLLSYTSEDYSISRSDEYMLKNSIPRIRTVLKKYQELNIYLKGRKVNIFLLPLQDEVALIKLFLEKIKPI